MDNIAFITAIQSDDIEYIKNILDTPGHISRINKLSPILKAIEANNLDIVKLFMKNLSIDLDPQGYELPIAAKYGNIEIVKYLIKNIRYWNQNKKSGRIKLYNLTIAEAAKNGNVEIGKLIMDKALNENIYPLSGLREASEKGNAKFVKFLLSYPFQDPSQGILTYAANRGNENIVRILLNDIRVNPSYNKNEAILKSLNETIINLLLSDDRTTNENLSSKLIDRKLKLLQNKLWSLKRLEFQDNRDIVDFLGTSLLNNNWKLRYNVLIFLADGGKLINNDFMMTHNNDFEKYFLMNDKQLLHELNMRHVKKFDYCTHGGAALLLAYLDNKKNKYLLTMLFDMVPIYVRDELLLEF